MRLKVVKRIVRCAATNVEPHTGIRDMEIPKTLMQAFGHMDCGIYAQVIDGGTIATRRHRSRSLSKRSALMLSLNGSLSNKNCCRTDRD